MERSPVLCEVTDPPLEGVHVDDRILVRDVISVLQALQHPLKLCKDWHVRPISSSSKTVGYDICATLETSSCDWQVQFSDLDLIKQLDYARVGNISVRGVGPTVQIQVNVAAKSVPVMVTQTDIIRVQKRHRWF